MKMINFNKFEFFYKGKYFFFQSNSRKTTRVKFSTRFKIKNHQFLLLLLCTRFFYCFLKKGMSQSCKFFVVILNVLLLIKELTYSSYDRKLV